jgi:sarcosine/dimethylglycine N-methyltransferase
VIADILMSPPSPLGRHTFVDNFTDKLRSLTRGLSTGRLRAIEGVARTTDWLRYP